MMDETSWWMNSNAWVAIVCLGIAATSAAAGFALGARRNRRATELLHQQMESRRALELRQQQPEKMDAIIRMARGVAHDFNNHLTAILGYSELLSEVMPEDSPDRSAIDAINKSAQAAAAFTRELLAVSHRQILHPELVAVNTVVTNAEVALRDLAGKKTALSLVLDPQAGKVEADVRQIQQAIANLVVHARNSLQDGGTIVIKTKNVDISDLSGAILGELHSGAHVELTISDDSSGISDEDRARIFEPFFLPKQKGNSGLSLAAARGIVRQSGGDISIQSEPGKGTTFRVCLPRADKKQS